MLKTIKAIACWKAISMKISVMLFKVKRRIVGNDNEIQYSHPG
jgi:hypothetical protein